MKDIKNKVYEQVAEIVPGRCKGCCALPQRSDLCVALSEAGGGSCGNQIWKEVEMENTALELVDAASSKIYQLTSRQYQEYLHLIKSAIEREQGAMQGRILKQEELLDYQQQEIKDTHKRLEAPAITMRPISELPDRVPEGCNIVGVNSHEVKFKLTCENMVPPAGGPAGATHFYTLPLPKAERKLKPCPWCGARPFQHNYCHWVVMHSISCAIEGSSIICQGKEDAWGRE